MWGAVIGDVAGSRFEGSRGGTRDFELFHHRCRYTDDTVCTAAIAHIVVNEQRPDRTLQQWCRRHPGRGYGGGFARWIASAQPRPYGSFGKAPPPIEDMQARAEAPTPPQAPDPEKPAGPDESPEQGSLF